LDLSWYKWRYQFPNMLISNSSYLSFVIS
jgi:hypothetical protein